MNRHAAGAFADDDAGTRPAIARDRVESFGFAGIVVVINGFAGSLVKAFYGDDLGGALLDLGGVSAIVWFALLGLYAIAGEKTGREPLRRFDRAVLACMFALAFFPLNAGGALGTLIGATYLWLTSPASSRGRRIAIVMFALTGPLVWGRLLLAFFGPLLLSVDAHLAGFLAGVPVHENVVEFHHGAGRLYVALGCSSLHNMSLAVLLFVVMTQLLRLRFTLPLLLVGAAAAASMAVVNILRLAAMARFPEYFDYIHLGDGGAFFGLASFVAAGAVIGFGIAATRPA